MRDNNLVKIILYYTNYFNNKLWTFGEGHKVFIKHKCPVTNCFLTSNRSALPSLGDFDALIFNYYKTDIVKSTGLGWR